MHLHTPKSKQTWVYTSNHTHTYTHTYTHRDIYIYLLIFFQLHLTILKSCFFLSSEIFFFLHFILTALCSRVNMQECQCIGWCRCHVGRSRGEWMAAMMPARALGWVSVCGGIGSWEWVAYNFWLIYPGGQRSYSTVSGVFFFDNCRCNLRFSWQWHVYNVQIIYRKINITKTLISVYFVWTHTHTHTRTHLYIYIYILYI